MVLARWKIFDQKIADSAAKGLISAAAATFVGRNLVKFIPLVGWGVSAVVAAGVTEAIGWTIAVGLARNAKQAWEDKTASWDTREDTDNIVVEDETNTQEIIPGLAERAAPFLSGEKTRKNNTEEYESLRRDFERILDDLDITDPLRESYDKLCLLIE